MQANEINAEPAYYTTAEVAQRLRVSAETVRWWRWESMHAKQGGKLRGPQGWVRVEGRWLMSRTALLAYEAGLTAFEIGV